MSKRQNTGRGGFFGRSGVPNARSPSRYPAQNSHGQGTATTRGTPALLVPSPSSPAIVL
jgi:hypothetical protein